MALGHSDSSVTDVCINNGLEPVDAANEKVIKFLHNSLQNCARITILYLLIFKLILLESTTVVDLKVP